MSSLSSFSLMWWVQGVSHLTKLYFLKVGDRWKHIAISFIQAILILVHWYADSDLIGLGLAYGGKVPMLIFATSSIVHKLTSTNICSCSILTGLLSFIKIIIRILFYFLYSLDDWLMIRRLLWRFFFLSSIFIWAADVALRFFMVASDSTFEEAVFFLWFSKLVHF